MTESSWKLFEAPLRVDTDVALARSRVRALSRLAGLSERERTRLAVATSELVRHALTAQGGTLTLGVDDTRPQRLWIEVLMQTGRASIPDSDPRPAGAALEGPEAAQKLMDHVERRAHPKGLVYRISRARPPRLAPLSQEALTLGVDAHLKSAPASDTAQEIAQQNRELVQVLEEVRAQSDALGQANLELEETNRGVVALHAELDARAELLRQASEIKSRLVSLVGHEFRTPLGSIQMLSELLLDAGTEPKLAPEHRRQVELIRGTAVELAGLVDDLLDLSKVQSGKMDIHVTTVDVASIFGDFRGLLRPLARSDAVKLVFELEEELPPMRTDASKISLILRNLISNALKFTSEGTVQVSARALSGDRIRFEVTDTGVGISPADHEHIFEEFSQVDNPLQAGVKGTGLGLTLVRRLAQMLGGDVRVRSELGKGSTFQVDLPRIATEARQEEDAAARARDERIRDRPPPASPSEQAGTQRPDLRPARQGPPRILIMDDDPSARHLLGHQLRQAGCLVQEAEDGARGLWLARRERPDLIFMDLEMPALSGWEVLPQLRTEPQTRAIPVVVYTGLEAEEVAASHLDAQGVLLKQGDLAGLGRRAMEFVRLLVPPEAEEKAGPHA